MYGLILTFHIIITLVLIVVVLIQSGKSGGMGGIFGGGGSEALLSAPSGNTFIKKVTVGLAVGFLATTLLLTVLHSKRTTRSVIQRVGVPQAGATGAAGARP